ncbi:putative FMN-dependent luciferase-like monooxygenase [Microbacterium protaetiae]|uniref:Putative FMN-dependent luciferase-like monooxygenase n=1 Tax=Microbacterium protaetiae TaxID=2509458 RepID=A0A4P6EGW9_9MICO|nr:putative FMN-dependent luciferase-like monooxygenase [Microbacterium protaetiae]QAY60723.1 putative FMN-dependent luciferase-like monooxygenase [Microbacterium protaetiae]
MQRTPRPRLGFFTRVLEEATAADRFRFAVEQIVAAERAGFDTAWVAQHHFDRDEGGLPSPFVLLAYAAAYTQQITLGTGIVALPLEDPVRVAEDAAVLTRLSGGRFELGVGSGQPDASFAVFGTDVALRHEVYQQHLARLAHALAGQPLTSDGAVLYPAAPELRATLWEATFSASGATRIGAAGNGLMLSRTQPRAQGEQSLAQVQRPIVRAYLDALPPQVGARVLASRTVFATDDRITARALAERAAERALPLAERAGVVLPPGLSTAETLAQLDVHVGTPAELVEALRADEILRDASDIVFQVHPVDPPHELVLRSIQLIAGEVAPALGWRPSRFAAPALSTR